jgi:hypothetical protein
MRCCARDEGRPFGTALRREVPNHRVLRWLKTVVVSDTGKGALDCVRWGSGRRCAVLMFGIAVDVSLLDRWHQNQGESGVPWEEPGGWPLTGRAVSGM